MVQCLTLTIFTLSMQVPFMKVLSMDTSVVVLIVLCLGV